MIELDLADHLARESARFATALRTAEPDAAVPTCPAWDADDLLWHLAKVQAFWATIVRERMTEAAQVETIEANRPSGRDALFEHFHAATRELQRALAAADDATPAWTWSSDQSVGFIRRRQAHEALIHRVDAEVTAGSRTSMDPRLCADGVDEVLRVMYGAEPRWGTFSTEDGSTVRLAAVDTGDSWLVALGGFTGVDPASGSPVDETDLRVVDTHARDDAAATIEGTAADLDCWLWHRPPVGEPRRRGDQDVLDRLAAVVARPPS